MGARQTELEFIAVRCPLGQGQPQGVRKLVRSRVGCPSNCRADHPSGHCGPTDQRTVLILCRATRARGSRRTILILFGFYGIILQLCTLANWAIRAILSIGGQCCDIGFVRLLITRLWFDSYRAHHPWSNSCGLCSGRLPSQLLRHIHF